ncbi:MAG: alpha/beta hydrolase [Planctomycetes bacterium]|nr:alpha/beta hydrolase [Planctomycetota bacterium]MCB9919752.1 alpha/beta hydrolase [Planctomycetota bacterium]
MMSIRPFASHLAVTCLAAASIALDATAQNARYRDALFSNVDRQSNIVFGSAVNRYTQQTETLRLDLYTPQGDTATTRAAVVVVHGGGFRSGDKGTAQFVNLCNDFAKRGYIAISINYRLRPLTQPLIRENAIDAAHDMKAAVRWLRKNGAQLRLDETRIACLGSSAGAITCCEAAYVPGEGSSGNPGFSSKVHAVIDLWGFLWDLSEMQAGEAPVQIIHGTNDQTVPYSHAVELDQRARQVGVPSELHKVQAGHAPWGEYNANFHVQHVVPFLYEHLRLAQVSGLGARAGWASPGTLTLDSVGVASDYVVLYVAGSTANIPAPPFGTLCLDPSSMVYLGALRLDATPRLPRASLRLNIPAGIRGDLHWQSIQLDGAWIRVLSNCVSTGF